MSLLSLLILFVASNFVTGLIIAYRTELFTAITVAFTKTCKVTTAVKAYLSEHYVLADTLFILSVITGAFLLIGLPFIVPIDALGALADVLGVVCGVISCLGALAILGCLLHWYIEDKPYKLGNFGDAWGESDTTVFTGHVLSTLGNILVLLFQWCLVTAISTIALGAAAMFGGFGYHILSQLI